MQYQAPEVIEIGNAQELIMGSTKPQPLSDGIDGRGMMVDYDE